jgi:hypothetical protein
LVSYRNIPDLRHRGVAWMANLLETAGLPLEIIHLQGGRVMSIHTFDYVEGEDTPLMERSWWWFDVCVRGAPVGPSGIVAVYPDGSQHLIAE